MLLNLQCYMRDGLFLTEHPSHWSLHALQRDGWDTLIVTAADSINQHVVSTLLKKYALVKHCDALRRYLLLGQGDFVQSLMDQVRLLPACPKLALARAPTAIFQASSCPGLPAQDPAQGCEMAGGVCCLLRSLGLLASSLLYVSSCWLVILPTQVNQPACIHPGGQCLIACQE